MWTASFYSLTTVVSWEHFSSPKMWHFSYEPMLLSYLFHSVAYTAYSYQLSSIFILFVCLLVCLSIGNDCVFWKNGSGLVGSRNHVFNEVYILAGRGNFFFFGGGGIWHIVLLCGCSRVIGRCTSSTHSGWVHSLLRGVAMRLVLKLLWAVL